MGEERLSGPSRGWVGPPDSGQTFRSQLLLLSNNNNSKEVRLMITSCALRAFQSALYV